MSERELRMELVEPQPDYIASSGRWHWPFPARACFEGCCTSVVTASREWWEYAPAEAKPHPDAGALHYNEKWYWIVPLVEVRSTKSEGLCGFAGNAEDTIMNAESSIAATALASFSRIAKKKSDFQSPEEWEKYLDSLLNSPEPNVIVNHNGSCSPANAADAPNLYQKLLAVRNALALHEQVGDPEGTLRVIAEAVKD